MARLPGVQAVTTGLHWRLLWPAAQNFRVADLESWSDSYWTFLWGLHQGARAHA